MAGWRDGTPPLHGPRAHGGLRDDELTALGLDPESVLDFSVNVNPYGPSPAVARAVRAAPLHRYPDPTATLVRRAIAAELDVDPAALLVGNGAVDLLWTLARALFTTSSTVAVVEPAFSELRAAAESAGARVEAWQARREDGFALDAAAIDAFLARARPDALYLCTPANPTGAPLAVDHVASLASAHPATLILLDQAFLSLSERHDDARRPVPDNVVRIRSLTKDHALAGLRVGYLIAQPPLVARLEASRPPWSASSLAQAAALAAIAEHGFIAESRTRLLRDRDRMIDGLRALGLEVHGSSTIYVLVRVGDAEALRRRLLVRHRVLVRDCASFGLPEHIRVCARPAADVERLLDALREEVNA